MAHDSASVQARQKRLAVYYQVGSISVAARRCGIAQSTLQRWIKRKELEGLEDRSRRPHQLARQQFDDEVENMVLQIRHAQNISRTADLKDAQLNDRLEEWQFYYNYQRSHSSLNGKNACFGRG